MKSRLQNHGEQQRQDVYVHRDLFLVRAPNEHFAQKLMSRAPVRRGVVTVLSPTEFLFAGEHLQMVQKRIAELQLPIRAISSHEAATNEGYRP